MCAQLVLVCYHPAERTAGADALLLRQLLIGHDVLAVEFLPCAHDVDIVEREAHPVAMVLGKVVGGLASQRLQLGGIAASDAPHVFHGQPFQRGYAVVVVVDDAAVTVHLELLRQFRGDLRQRLVRCEADAHGQPHGAPDALVQTLAPLLEIDALHAVEIDEALVDAVAEVGGRLLADDHHHARGQVAIQLVVAAEDGDILIFKLLLHLEIGCALLDTQCLRLVAAGHYATVVIA